MKRILIAACSVLAALLVAVPVASADRGGDDGDDRGGESGFTRGGEGFGGPEAGDAFGPGFGPPRGWWRDHDDDAPEDSDIHIVAGTVTAVDATGSTISVQLRCNRGSGPVAEAAHRRGDGERGGEDGQRASDEGDDDARTVTVKADADTLIVRNGAEATLADVKSGDKLRAEIATEEPTSLEQALAAPAWLIVAKGKKVAQTYYGFGGRVVSIDEPNGKLVVNVTRATVSARKLLGAGAKELTFTVDDDTYLQRGRRGADLDDFAANDLVGIGIRAPKGSTLEQVVAAPAKRVLALSRGSAGSSVSSALRRLSLKAAGVRR